MLAPDDDGYCVHKPKHSAFYATTLDTLLAYLGAKTVILTGITSSTKLDLSAIKAGRRGRRSVKSR